MNLDSRDRVEDYSHLSPTGQRLVRRFRDCMVELVAASTPDRVLEVGCGQGWLLHDIARAVPGASLFGLDIRDEAIEFASTLVPEAHLLVADASELPFLASEFDIVICAEVLEHVANPARVLAEIDRVGTGHAVFSVPHEPWFWSANLLRGKYLRSAGNCPGHIHHWSRGSFRRLLLQNGGSATVERSFPWLIAEVRR